MLLATPEPAPILLWLFGTSSKSSGYPEPVPNLLPARNQFQIVWLFGTSSESLAARNQFPVSSGSEPVPKLSAARNQFPISGHPEPVPNLVHRKQFLSFWLASGYPESVPILMRRNLLDAGNQFLSWGVGLSETGASEPVPKRLPMGCTTLLQATV